MYYVMCSTYSVPRHAIDARCNIFCGSSIELRGDRAVFENWAGTANTYTTRITGNLGTRAVHVELAPDYCPEKFVMVLRWFVSLRGYPAKLLSDNGTRL